MKTKIHFTLLIAFLLIYLTLNANNPQPIVDKTALVVYVQDTISVPDSIQEKKYKIKIGGVIQVHYLNEFNTNGDTIRDPDGFRILRVRLTAEGKINKYISYVVMIDPRAPEQGGILRDAYIDLKVLKGQTLRFGQQKTRFGWENGESITQLYTVSRAEMSDAVSRGINLRDIGIGCIGRIKLNKHFDLEDEITFTNGTRFNVTGPYDFNSKKALWGRVGVKYKKKKFSAKWGGSFGAGGIRDPYDLPLDPSDDVYINFKRYGTDLQVDHKNFFLAAEYASGTDHVSDTLYDDPFGYQALLAIKTKYKIGPLVRYDVFQDEWKVLTVGAYYGLPKDKLRVLVNYVFRGNITDIPRGHDDRLYIQMQIVF